MSQCVHGDDHIYRVTQCNHFISGDLCGNRVPGDNHYGDCEATDKQFRICYTADGEDDACADFESVDDCAVAVAEKITEGICHESGIFTSNLCMTDRSRTVCACQAATNASPEYQESSVQQSVFTLSNFYKSILETKMKNQDKSW